MKREVVDLHCDLLSYLVHQPGATAYDPCVRCAIPQLRRGGVILQVLALYAPSHAKALASGLQQMEMFTSLENKYPEDFYFYKGEQQQNKIGVIPAIENLSAICDETDPLDRVEERLDHLETMGTKPLYFSMTWNQENRFGGGAETTVGLRSDGKEILKRLSGKGIALDLSHASDLLLEETLEFLDRDSLEIPVMASHSNCRALIDVTRNLPDRYIQEIFARNGIIGVNFIERFIGEDLSPVDHIHHLLNLGGERKIALGADFFYEKDPNIRRAEGSPFAKEYQDASCYGTLREKLGVELDILKGIFSQNALNYFTKNRLKSP